jgi:hypothetical protein
MPFLAIGTAPVRKKMAIRIMMGTATNGETLRLPKPRNIVSPRIVAATAQNHPEIVTYTAQEKLVPAALEDIQSDLRTGSTPMLHFRYGFD